MRSLAGAAVAALVAACALQAATKDLGGPATLTPASPMTRIALGPPPPRDAVLEIDVIEVRNPSLAPVVISVSIQGEDERMPAQHISEVALFPADRPGRFVARADEAIGRDAAMPGHRPGSLWAVVTLRSQADLIKDAPRLLLQVSARWAP